MVKKSKSAACDHIKLVSFVQIVFEKSHYGKHAHGHIDILKIKREFIILTIAVKTIKTTYYGPLNFKNKIDSKWRLPLNLVNMFRFFSSKYNISITCRDAHVITNSVDKLPFHSSCTFSFPLSAWTIQIP